jgi:hypothetical protein
MSTYWIWSVVTVVKSPPNRAVTRSAEMWCPSVGVSAGARNSCDSSRALSRLTSPVTFFLLILRYGVTKKP